MRNNDELIAHLVRSGVLEDPALIAAFRHADRGCFVPVAFKADAYADEPIPIGYNQTISQPTTVAFMLELLEPRAGEKILDIGSGSGWTAALLAYVVGESGSVRGIEIIPELVAMGRGNLLRCAIRKVDIALAGPVAGLPEEAPFDKILVSAAAAELPQALVGQLAAGGKLVIPVGGSIWKIEKRTDGTICTEEFPGFAFVPLK